jgi:hypothetical protein
MHYFRTVLAVVCTVLVVRYQMAGGCMSALGACNGSFAHVPPTVLMKGGVSRDAADVCEHAWPKLHVLPNQRQRQRSTHDEDLVIYRHFFRGSQGGTYLEIGANDGHLESNSRFFEECLHWKGVLVEGEQTNFRFLAQRRPGAHKFNFVPGCPTFSVREMESHANTGAMMREGGGEWVHCAPLPVYLKAVGVTFIDFFSLDVEGAEDFVLQTLPGLGVHVLMVESQNRHCKEVCPKRERVRSRLLAMGFRLYTNLVARSDVFVNASLAQPNCSDCAK